MDNVTPATPAAAAPVTTDPATKAALDAALAKLADMEKRENDRRIAEEQTKLSTEFAAIKDWTAVAGTTYDEKRAAAAKLVAMLAANPAPGAAPTKPVVTNPGSTFTPPPMGAPGGEVGDHATVVAKKGELAEAVRSGNVKRALDLCVELQPNAMRHLYQDAKA